MPAISVIVPTRKRNHLLPRCLQSLYAQTFEDFEIILIDDNPPQSRVAKDGALNGLLSDKRLRILEHPKPRNAAAARNFGLPEARGDWITYLDDDDLYRSHKLDRQFRLAREARAPLVACGLSYRLVGRTRARNTARTQFAGDELLLEFPGMQTLFHRRTNVRFNEDLPNIHDMYFYQELIRGFKVDRVPNVPASLVDRYLNHGGERVSWNNEAVWNGHVAVVRDFGSRYSERARDISAASAPEVLQYAARHARRTGENRLASGQTERQTGGEDDSGRASLPGAFSSRIRCRLLSKPTVLGAVVRAGPASGPWVRVNLLPLLCAAAIGLSSAAQAGPQLSVFWWDSPANIDRFGQWLGIPVEIASSFTAKASASDIDATKQLAIWSPWVKAQPGRNLLYAVALVPRGGSLASCADGQYDVNFRNLANNLAYYGLGSAYLRLGWEMDGRWFPWSAPKGSGKEASFAACFRRAVQTMRQAQPANRWKFVFNPTDNAGHHMEWLEKVWPGDDYVDVVGVDLYDQLWGAPNTYPYPSSCDAACRLTHQKNAWRVFAFRLRALRHFALARGKSMAFPEWGVVTGHRGHGGGDNPYFIQKMHEFIADPANKVVFHSYFNISAKKGGFDCRLTEPGGNDLPGQTQMPNSAALFKQLFGSR